MPDYNTDVYAFWQLMDSHVKRATTASLLLEEQELGGGFEAWKTMWAMYSPIVEGSRSGMKGAIWAFAKTSTSPKQLLERIVKLDATVARFQREIGGSVDDKDLKYILVT